MDDFVVISHTLLQKMISHSQSASPNECCGVLGGKGEEITSIYPVANILHSPDAFFADPAEMFEAMREMRRNGEKYLGIYHSHPHQPPIPSQKDREENGDSHRFNIIISLSEKEPVVRCYHITAEREYLNVPMIEC